MTGASGDIATVTTPAGLADAGEAFLGLPNHLVVTHILSISTTPPIWHGSQR
jgi:hypothetical protein|tara:strand:- start:393 stop:548 length:156 start_codon:yes stop_codon:yes gene_type:complete